MYVVFGHMNCYVNNISYHAMRLSSYHVKGLFSKYMSWFWTQSEIWEKDKKVQRDPKYVHMLHFP